MARRRKRNKPNATGRNSSNSRFARLDHRILASNAYRSLTPNSRSLLVELIMLSNGENNGSLYLSVRDAAHRLGVADLTAASRAFDELQSLGFIEMTQDAHYNVKASNTSRARCWRLTWLPGPGRKQPNWACLEREPEPQTPARRRMERGLRALKTYKRAREQNRLPLLDSNTLSPDRFELPASPVLDSSTPNSGNGTFPPKCIVRDSNTHIAITRGGRVQNFPIGWWQPDWANLSPIISLAALLARSAGARASDRRQAA